MARGKAGSWGKLLVFHRMNHSRLAASFCIGMERSGLSFNEPNCLCILYPTWVRILVGRWEVTITALREARPFSSGMEKHGQKFLAQRSYLSNLSRLRIRWRDGSWQVEKLLPLLVMRMQFL